MRPALLALAAAAGATAAAAADATYWWRYPHTDAENLDIEQLPCAHSCTLEQLETACAANAECVAFNTNGWLKKSIADMAPDSCDLYVKKDTPQPSPTPTPPPPPIYFWPQPAAVTWGGAPAFVDPTGFKVTVNPPSALVSDYAARLLARVFQNQPAGPAPPGALGGLTITLSQPDAPLQLGVDESYTLSVSAGGGATLAAVTPYGAMAGLQTLSQAVRFDFDAGQYAVQATPLSVTDAPRFSWRGLLVDTDRHWLSLEHLRRIVDSMTYAKLNVLHWHLVDWQSWPVQTRSYPGLWNASWSARERYTLADVAAVVAYANGQGVRVVLEFDTPGHASSMCVAYPQLCVADVAGCGPTGNAPLSPVPVGGRNASLDAIGAVLGELAALSGDTFVHLGGDEVDQSCWANSAAVKAWMATQGLMSTDQVYEYFVAAVDEIALGMGKVPTRWEEVWAHFGTQLDKRTIIHAWLSSEAVINATNNGYRAIWSVDGKYYLDSLGEPWQSFYDVDILAGMTNASAIPLILGGETCMWGETADGSDVLQTIWPRAAAAAERQWSYNVVTNSSAPGVAERLQAFRCLLLERGIPAAPVTNANARSAPAGPGSCMAQ